MMSASIKLNAACVEFPVFNAGNVSLKNTLIEAVLGRKGDKKLSSKETAPALTGIDLKIQSGDRLGLVGHNGAGKTTLLRLLAGIFRPISGSVEISGSVMPLINFDLGMNMEASGYENILLSGLVLGLPHDEIEHNMDAIIAFSGLGDAIYQPVRTYSSGMRMRLAFSLSTSVRSQILLLDEWLSVGDEDFQKSAKDRMNEMVDASEIIILSSHSREIIESVCNRVVFLENGKIVADGDVDEVCNLYFGEKT